MGNSNRDSHFFTKKMIRARLISEEMSLDARGNIFLGRKKKWKERAIFSWSSSSISMCYSLAYEIIEGNIKVYSIHLYVSSWNPTFWLPERIDNECTCRWLILEYSQTLLSLKFHWQCKSLCLSTSCIFLFSFHFFKVGKHSTTGEENGENRSRMK